jgi:hypothetical protein
MKVEVVKNSEIDSTCPEDYARVTWFGEDPDDWRAKVFHISDPRLQRYLEAVGQLKYELGVGLEEERGDDG